MIASTNIYFPYLAGDEQFLASDLALINGIFNGLADLIFVHMNVSTVDMSVSGIQSRGDGCTYFPWVWLRGK